MASEDIHTKHDLFENLDGETAINETESLCMNCHKTGITRFLMCKIPHFKDIVLMAFNCDECGFNNNEIQSAQEIAQQGCTITLDVSSATDLNRRVVRTEKCIVTIPALELTISPTAASLTTVEGILEKASSELKADQPARLVQDYNAWKKIQEVVDALDEHSRLENGRFTIILDDPSGNSYVENPNAPNSDPACVIKHYTRSREQDEALGMYEQNHVEPDTAGLGLDLQHDIHTFKTPCSRCGVESETRMHMLGLFFSKYTEIPHFKQVIVMSTVCESCGYRSNEVKAGGAVSEKGKRITLKLTSPSDLSRDILKSETCGLTIPEIDLTLQPGTLGGRFTTIEGLLRQVYEEIDEKAAFRQGDSVDPARKLAFDAFLLKLNQVIEMKDGDCYTIILDDPMANSYLQNLYAPDEDPEMTIEDYERTWEQNEEWGLNDIKTEGY